MRKCSSYQAAIRSTELRILTAEEFERFEMNSNPAGTELARRVIGMEPTDVEFHAMFRIAWDHWVETGGVGGLWRAERVPPEQIAAADDRMHERLLETLGPDRYLDHQMATTQTGQQLRNFAARYDLPRETLAEAFQLQIEAERVLESLRRPQPPGTAFDPAHFHTHVEDLQQRMELVLGPALLHAWMDGRNQRVKLEP